MRHFYARSIQIIAFHSVKTTKDKQPLVIEDDCLVKSARCGRNIEWDTPCPSLHLEVVLVNVIKTLEGKVYASKDIHGLLCSTGRVSVPTLDAAVHLGGLQPDSQTQVKDWQVVKSHLAVPSTKYVHVVHIDHCSVAKSYLGFGQQVEVVWDLAIGDQLYLLLWVWLNFSTFNIAPAIGSYLVAVHVWEYMGLVTTTVDVKPVEIADKWVISAGLGWIKRSQVYPFFLYGLKLCQIIEVDTSFPCVASEKENTVFKRQTVGTRPWSWLLVGTLRTELADLFPIVGDYITNERLVSVFIRLWYFGQGIKYICSGGMVWLDYSLTRVKRIKGIGSLL